MFRQGGTDDVREKLIDVMYENQKLSGKHISNKRNAWGALILEHFLD